MVFSQDIYAGISYVDVSPSSSSPEMYLYVYHFQNKLYASVNLLPVLSKHFSYDNYDSNVMTVHQKKVSENVLHRPTVVEV